ncbi:MAG: hypothetical protein H6588_08455 [Flavobacteriales bacterium]|nr:hypothetical protein [Flavobacteriales bacterium]
MKLIFTLIISILSVVASAQSFAEQHYQYDVNYKMMQGYYNRGLYQEATQHIDSLKDNRYVNGQDYYFFARVYSLNNEFDKSLFYLEKAVKGGTTKSDVERMYDLDKFRESHLNIVFELNYDKWHQEYLSWVAKLKIDSVYYKEIELIKQKGFLSRYKKSEKIDGDDVFVLKDSIDLIEVDKQDSINFEDLTDLIVRKGFPTYKKVGGAAFEVIIMLKNRFINGFNDADSKWVRIKPLLLKELELGNLKPFIYGEFEDRARVTEKRPQLYLTSGSFVGNRLVEVDLIEKPEELNIRRKSIGLCPIEIEYWSSARELPLSLQEVKFK